MALKTSTAQRISAPFRHRIRERIYVKVISEFDSTGYMQPTAIKWNDGRIFSIDAVRDFRPAGTVGTDVHGDCFTVVIGGKERHLYFERTDPMFRSQFGRWFVEKDAV